MSVDELLAYLERVRFASIATVKPSGAPHIVPVFFVHNRGKIYVNTSMKSIRYRNITRNNRVALTFLEGSKAVILEGIASVSGKTSEFVGGDVGRAFLMKYGKERRITPYSVMLEIVPTRIFTYKGVERGK